VQPALNPECTREVEVEVPAEEVTKSFRTVLKKYQKLARIPGFRPGKVPETVLRSRFAGADPRRSRRGRRACSLSNGDSAKRSAAGIAAAGDRSATGGGQPLRFKAAFEIAPEFSVEGYQSVKVEKPETELTDAEFDTELERIRDARSTMETVTDDRGLVDGDWAQITFTARWTVKTIRQARVGRPRRRNRSRSRERRYR